MRCLSCNCNLNDAESTRRVASTMEFLDLCNTCYRDIEYDVPTISRSDLNQFEQIGDDMLLPEQRDRYDDEGEWDER